MDRSISIDNGVSLDCFRRIALARSLFDAIVRIDASSSGAVIGLEGSWGSGKSHVLKHLDSIAQEVSIEQRPVLIRFNPWMVSGARDIVNALLVQVSAELAADGSLAPRRRFGLFRKSVALSKGARLATALIRYANLLRLLKDVGWISDAIVPGSGLTLSAAGHAAEAVHDRGRDLTKDLDRFGRHPAELSLHEARRCVVANLHAHHRRLVVVVDDLDRLPPKELAAIVQAVKAVADFPNVVYVLAYDPEIVARSLKTALHVRSGRAYLEKIVHLPIRIPAVPAALFHSFAVDRLQTAVNDLSLKLDPMERQDLKIAFILAAAMLQSPRNVERLRTRLLFSLSALAGQLNLADVLMLEAIDQCAPSVSQWIEDNPSLLTRYSLHRLDEDLLARDTFANDGLLRRGADNKSEQEREDSINGWITVWPKRMRPMEGVMRNALAFLFDAIPAKSSRSARSNYRRCQNFRYLYRWHCRGESHDLFGVSEIAELLSSPGSLATSRVVRDVNTFSDFCAHLCDLQREDIPLVDVGSFVELFSIAEARFGMDVVLQTGMGFGPMSALFRILERGAPEETANAVTRLVESASVWVSVHVLLRANRDEGDIRSGAKADHQAIALPQGDLRLLANAWYEKAQLAIRTESWATDDPEDSIHALLSYAWQLGCDESVLRGAMCEAFIERRLSLQQCFGDLRDRLRSRPLQPTVAILPPIEALLDRVNEDAEFEKSHTEFVEGLRGWAARDANVNSTPLRD